MRILAVVAMISIGCAGDAVGQAQGRIGVYQGGLDGKRYELRTVSDRELYVYDGDRSVVRGDAPGVATEPLLVSQEAPGALHSGQIKNVQFTFVDAVADAKTLDITLTVLNKDVDRRIGTGWNENCSATVIDQDGNSYAMSNVMLGNQSIHRKYADILNGVPTKMTMKFDGLATKGGVPTIQQIKRLTFSAIVTAPGKDPSCRAGAGSLELRDLPVKRP